MFSPRLYIASAILVVALILTGVLSDQVTNTRVAPSLARPIEGEVNRIAYVGLDAQVRSINPSGDDERQLSPRQSSPFEGVYTWPTWSPDAQHLVFSGISTDGGADPRVSLFSVRESSGELEEIYVGEPGVVGLLADGVIHYPLWSPDSQKVAFVAVASGGLTLFLDDFTDGTDSRLVLDQGPLWMSWSPDSQYLAIHRGAEHFLMKNSAPFEVTRQDIESDGYRVPAWNPISQDVTLAVDQGNSRSVIEQIVVSNGKLGDQKSIMEVSSHSTFLWSPSGLYVAIGDSSRRFLYLGVGMFVHQAVRIVSPDSDAPDRLIEDNVVAFFWSPDGSKLAYVSLSETPQTLRWNVLDVVDGSQTPLMEFVPSRDQLTMFQFFDQYAYSHALWSPDSRAIVFAGTNPNAAVTASFASHPGHEGTHIIVLDAVFAGSSQVIADGILGFWSPR